MPNNEIEIMSNAQPIAAHEHLQIGPFESGLLRYLETFGLPSKGIFASIDERRVTVSNLQNVIVKIPQADRSDSTYLSKYVAAAAAGLFDAALNYLWDETIIQLRTRVSQYDLSYFYDNAVTSQDRRSKLKDASDLDKITDDELVRGAHAIGLIGEIGFRHLDYIRYMRNWVSAAHPNQNEITGLQILSWLETCIKEVITLPLSNSTVEIKRLLESIKTQVLDDPSASEIGVFFAGLTQEQVDSLAAGFFGIYVRPDTIQQTRTNILKLFPFLWPRISTETKESFGVRYGKFSAANDQAGKSLAHQILSSLGGLQYIPDDIRAVQIDDIMSRLITVHNGRNNFYNEPPFASQLEILVGQNVKIPRQICSKYVQTLVFLFMSNGNGVAWNAEPIYLRLIDNFDLKQMTIAVLSFQDTAVASRLQFQLCREKYYVLLTRIKGRSPLPALTEMIDFLLAQKSPPEKWRIETSVQNRIKTLIPLVNV